MNGDSVHREGDLAERIERSLDTVRPYLRMDGGDVKFLRFRENGTVELLLRTAVPLR